MSVTIGNVSAKTGRYRQRTTEETIDEMSARRPWRTPRLPELVGAKETCAILAIQKMTLNRWMRPNSGTLGPERTYMIPPKRIDAGPVWVRSDVERFAVEIGRQRAPAGVTAED